jgi:hypothetical protein
MAYEFAECEVHLGQVAVQKTYEVEFSVLPEEK